MNLQGMNTQDSTATARSLECAVMLTEGESRLLSQLQDSSALLKAHALPQIRLFASLLCYQCGYVTKFWPMDKRSKGRIPEQLR